MEVCRCRGNREGDRFVARNSRISDSAFWGAPGGNSFLGRHRIPRGCRYAFRPPARAPHQRYVRRVVLARQRKHRADVVFVDAAGGLRDVSRCHWCSQETRASTVRLALARPGGDLRLPSPSTRPLRSMSTEALPVLATPAACCSSVILGGSSETEMPVSMRLCASCFRWFTPTSAIFYPNPGIQPGTAITLLALRATLTSRRRLR